MGPLPTCTKCGKSPWTHALGNSYLYCREVGGDRSSFTIEVVNEVRHTIGKAPISRADGR